MSFRIIPEHNIIDNSEYRSIGFRIVQQFDDRTFVENVKSSLPAGVAQTGKEIKKFLFLAGSINEPPSQFGIKEITRLVEVMEKLFLMLDENSTLNLFFHIGNRTRVAFMLVSPNVTALQQGKLDSYIKFRCLDETLYLVKENEKVFRTFYVELSPNQDHVPVLNDAVEEHKVPAKRISTKFDRLIDFLGEMLKVVDFRIEKQGEGKHEVAVIDCRTDVAGMVSSIIGKYPVKTGWDFGLHKEQNAGFISIYFREWKIGSATGFRWNLVEKPDGTGLIISTPQTVQSLCNSISFYLTMDGRVKVEGGAIPNCFNFDISVHADSVEKRPQVVGAGKQFVQWVGANHPLLKKKPTV